MTGILHAPADGWRYPVALTPTLQANTWYTLTLLVDDLRGNTIEVYSDPNGPRYTYNIALTSGKTWRFKASVWSGTVYLDYYQEFRTNSGAPVSPDERMQFTYDSLDRVLSANKTTTEGYPTAISRMATFTAKPKVAGRN